MYVCIYLCMYPFINLSIHLSLYPFIRPSIYQAWISNCSSLTLAGTIHNLDEKIIVGASIHSAVCLAGQLRLLSRSQHCLYACYGLNLHRGSKPKHVRDVGKYLPRPGTKCFCLNCLFQAVWKNPLLPLVASRWLPVAFELSTSNLYNSNAHRASNHLRSIPPMADLSLAGSKKDAN